ncbi:hypothetical protein MBLNU230_g2057t1 [Neophaeotheca triangularis]
MRRVPRAEQALRLANSQTPTTYICHTCRAQLQTPSRRAFSSTRLLAADEKVPFYKRIQQTLFGRDEKVDQQQMREDKRRARAEEQAAQRERDLARVVVDRKTGKEYLVADVVDAEVNKQYVATQDWREMDRVGSEEWVKRRADSGEEFVGFSAPVKAKAQLSYQEWLRLLHHVTVEVLALYKARRDVNQVCNFRTSDARPWEQTITTTIDVRADGTGVALRFPSPEDEQTILSAISQQPPEEEAAQDAEALERLWDVQQAEFQGILSTGGDTVTGREMVEKWLALPLTAAPEIKYAIMKRIIQVTGHRPFEPALSSALSLGDLLHAFRALPKPKKLAQRKEMVSLGKESGNVQVHSNRRTPIHREKEVGRWKVIERALIERDLPVTGSRWPSSKLSQ